MRKALVLAAVFALSVSLCGCSNQTGNLPDMSSETNSVGESVSSQPASLLTGKESESTASEDAPAESSQQSDESSAQMPNTTEQSMQTQQVVEAPAPQEEKTAPSVTEQPRKETPVPQPPAPTPNPTPEPTPEPAPEPEPQPPAPSFDVNEYIGYAQSYGVSIGLSLDSTATACWDDPLSASANSVYLERDLKDRLDWYKASGFTAFCVWSVDLGGGSYHVYIGYA